MNWMRMIKPFYPHFGIVKSDPTSLPREVVKYDVCHLGLKKFTTPSGTTSRVPSVSGFPSAVMNCASYSIRSVGLDYAAILKLHSRNWRGFMALAGQLYLRNAACVRRYAILSLCCSQEGLSLGTARWRPSTAPIRGPSISIYFPTFFHAASVPWTPMSKYSNSRREL